MSAPTDLAAPSWTILIVEDEEAIRRFLRASLGALGYRIKEACLGREGLAMAASTAPDLVLLDLGLPDMDGLEVLSSLREFLHVPVIILSARGRERDKVDGLDAGADDYLTKPFGVAELAARIRTALRSAMRRASTTSQTAITAGDITIDMIARSVTKAGQIVHLTPNEFRLLTILARHGGLVVTQNQLIQEMWGRFKPDFAKHLRVYIHQLRRKLENEPANPQYLITEPWVGFRLQVDDGSHGT